MAVLKVDESAKQEDLKELKPTTTKQDSEVAEKQKKIDEQAEEIRNLREVLSMIGSGEGDLRDAKLIELFKKVKFLNVQLERERTRNRNMRKTVTFIQEELQRREGPQIHEDKFVKKGIHYWVDKYQRTSTKLMEAHFKIGTLDSKILKLQFALHREVGDLIPIQKYYVRPHKSQELMKSVGSNGSFYSQRHAGMLCEVIDEGTGWVGRSEQISLLKDKVAELKRFLAELMPEGMPPGYTTAFHDDRRTVEILHRNQVEKLDHDRRIQYDTLAQDFMSLTRSWGEQRDKIHGINARRNILEKEINKAKDTIAILLSKSKNDDLLINALSAELAGSRQAAGPPYLPPAGPTQMEHAARTHKLAAQYHELTKQCHEQEIRIMCQGEIINTFQDALQPPDNVTDWVTTNLLQSSYKSEQLLITADDF